MSSSGSLTSGVAGRYATALFEIAREGGSLDKVENDLLALEAALVESADFRDMIASPVFSREDTSAAVAAIAARMGLGREVTSTIGLMAANRRLFAIPGLIAAVKALIAAQRGVVTAEVTAAKPLTNAQLAALRDKLGASMGRNIVLNVTVDESLIGGMVVKVGSRMVDSSIRSKLANLKNIMKEVG